MVCLNRPYNFKFFKGCLPQILPGLFLNTLSRIFLKAHYYNILNHNTGLKFWAELNWTQGGI